MDSALSILCVGNSLDLADKSVNWTDEYNIKDHNFVIFDYWTISKYVEGSSFYEKFDTYMNSPDSGEIKKYLARGNNILVILPDREKIKMADRRTLTITRGFPISFALVEESGNSIDPRYTDEDWDWYFNEDGFDWHVRLSGSFEINGTDIEGHEVNFLSANLTGEPLAAEVITNPSRSQTGRILFIPMQESWTPIELMIEVLNRFTSIDSKVEVDSAPTWVDDFSFPGEDEALGDLESLVEEKTAIESQIEETQQELDEYQKYKILLHGNEYSLEELVPEIFQRMGFETSGEEPHHRDGIVEVDGTKVVMEITGTTGGIKTKKCRQLDQWVGDLLLEDEEQDYRGVLVVNPLRDQHPDDRKENEFLPPHVEKFLKIRGYRIMLTSDLYSIYSMFIDGELGKEEIENMLLGDEFFISP